MGEIGSYILPLVSISAVMGVMSAVSTDGFSEETAHASRLIAAFVIISLALPILSDLELPAPPKLGGGSTPAGGYVEVSRDAFEDGVAVAVAERIGVSERSVSVKADGFVFESMRAERLTVTLSRDAVLADVRGLSAWLSENFLSDGGRCEVVMDFE